MLSSKSLQVSRIRHGSVSTRRAYFVLRSGAASASDAPLKISMEQISDQLFLEASTKPKAVLGHISILESSGRGRGLGASRTLQYGELVLVAPSISMITAEDLTSISAPKSGSIEERDSEKEDVLSLKFEALQRKLLTKKYTSAELAWLRSLVPAPEEEDEEGEDMRETTSTSTDDRQRHSEVSISVAGTPALDSLITNLAITAEKTERVLAGDDELDFIEGVIQANAFEADSEDADLAYASGRTEPVQEIMGLWPHYALLNHSCTPNTVSYVHQGMLITRANRSSVGKGSELYTNYLGDLLLSPLDVRREALEDTYGFVCSCTRCREEEKLPKDLVSLIADIYEACTEQVREDLEEAVSDDDMEALQSLRDQLVAFVEVLDAAFTKKKVPEKTQIWIQLSLFELYELLATTLEVLGQTDKSLLELIQALTAEAQPGSDTHCYYSRRLLAAHQEEDAAEGEAASTSNASSSGVSGAKSSSSSCSGVSGAKSSSSSSSGVSGAKSSSRGMSKAGREGDDAGPAVRMMGDGSKHAQNMCYKAYSARYGPLSQRVFRAVLKKRKRRMHCSRSISKGFQCALGLENLAGTTPQWKSEENSVWDKEKQCVLEQFLPFHTFSARHLDCSQMFSLKNTVLYFIACLGLTLAQNGIFIPSLPPEGNPASPPPLLPPSFPQPPPQGSGAPLTASPLLQPPSHPPNFPSQISLSLPVALQPPLFPISPITALESPSHPPPLQPQLPPLVTPLRPLLATSQPLRPPIVPSPAEPADPPPLAPPSRPPTNLDPRPPASVPPDAPQQTQLTLPPTSPAPSPNIPTPPAVLPNSPALHLPSPRNILPMSPAPLVPPHPLSPPPPPSSSSPTTSWPTTHASKPTSQTTPSTQSSKP
ncbi:hypothetical protein CEUSTIGMA_g7049.t1 [Chlamydomonas eustigma]|uniref:SET domain-containing protein n=1 Tax=Chlamydomonas eustigma TaxID=1157962 RepID=A0A250X960_9CHLO|nr:hypothetical protein CEUSTIGMA_g7049.t1 [Chlamydomonas eustigma]|eukprot:GAX79608.1 hypothetical protein CEUSTIGMA_g7049.t1 [Chlamydomonas eustigma]